MSEWDYYQDHDVRSIIARTNGKVDESWDYQKEKWVQDRAAEETIRDMYNHIQLSEADAQEKIAFWAKDDYWKKAW